MFKLIYTVMAVAASASHLENLDGEFDSFKFDEVVFKAQPNKFDNTPEIRNWLDSDAPSFIWTQFKVAEAGVPRLELYNFGKKVDVVPVHLYRRNELNELLEKMGQFRV